MEESQGFKFNNRKFSFVMDTRVTCFAEDVTISHFASHLSLDEYSCQVLAESRTLVSAFLGARTLRI